MMIDFYLSIYDTELIGGEIKKAYMAMNALKKYAEKRKNRSSIMEAASKFASLNLDFLDKKIDFEKVKEEMKGLAEKYPEFFMLEKIGVGDVEKTLDAYLQRLEYAYNRYDPAMPYFNMQRCDDL